MHTDISIAESPAPHSIEVRPRLLRLSQGADRAEIERLLADQEIEVHDTLQAQLRELVQTRRPERALSAQERVAGILELLDGRTLAEHGVWVHYPWSGRLVHLLDREEFIELRTSRNRYLITAEEQARLAEKRVGIVGLSVGQSVALAIALERGCGELRLADHDTLELSNLNRLRAGLHEVGLPKVVIAAREIAELDPYLEVRCFPEGLTEASQARFFSLGGRLDLVLDECDGLDMKVRLRERARELRIPVLMQTSDRGLLDIERFDLEPERPLFHGLAGDLRAEGLVGLSNEQKVPHVLKILGVEGLSTRMRASLMEVEQSIRTWPQLGSAVALGGGVAADAARRVLLGQLQGSGRFYVDLAELVEPSRSSSLRDPSPVPSPFGRGGAPGLEPLAVRSASSPGGWMAPGDASKSSLGRPPSPGGGGAEGGVARKLVGLAILAPSGGNHQPWKWVASGSRISLYEDPARRMGLTDFQDLGSAVALGAAAENLVLAAHREGLEVGVEVAEGGAPEGALAVFELAPRAGAGERHDFDALAAQLESRRTDRRLGDRSPLSGPAWQALREAARSVEGVGLQMLTGREDIDALARLVGQGDRLRLLDAGLSREMFGELRWSQEEAAKTGDGLEVEAEPDPAC